METTQINIDATLEFDATLIQVSSVPGNKPARIALSVSSSTLACGLH